MTRRFSSIACVVLTVAMPLLWGAEKVPVPQARPQQSATSPTAATGDTVSDLSHAIPAKALSNLPPTADQFQILKTQIAKDKPTVATAKTTSDALARQAEILQHKLVTTAARVATLEREKARLDIDIARLTADNERLSASFERDRASVSRLLAILERLQHDMPPAMALRPDDALSAARGAMLIGASLPSVYDDAAVLARRIDLLRSTRQALVLRRAQAARNADYLAQARIELDQLVAMKRLEADAAQSHYGDLKAKLDKIASEAANLQALLEKVANLRSNPAVQSVVTVTAQNGAAGSKLARNSLVCPVVGMVVSGGMDGVGGAAAPGLTYVAGPGGQVISPADGTVLFAGPYHKSGQVLILEMADGYDAVLAGLDHLDVRPDDQVLAGEPVGTMSKSSQQPRLYFELRQNGRAMNPAPFIMVALRKAKRT